MSETCEDCVYFEESNINRLSDEKEVIAPHCLLYGGCVLIDELEYVCQYFKKNRNI